MTNEMNSTLERTSGAAVAGAAPCSARSVQRISKFLRVVSDESMPDERGVMSNDNKLIAIIGYYKPWREWVLYPQPNTVWSTDCLVAIKSHLAWMSKVLQGPNDRTERQPPGEAAACNQTSHETKSADTGKRGGCSLQ